MTRHLIVTVGTPTEDATALAVANGCVGFYLGVPPIWVPVAETQGWTIPCVVTEDEAGDVVSWEPAV